MAESVGVAAAATQFAELLFKAAKLAREIYAATDAAHMAGHIAQLESCAAVGHKIAESSLPDDPITAGIVQRYIPKVKSLIAKLSHLRINETDGLFRKLKKAVESLLKEKEIKDFFAELRRDERVLLLHRVFASKTDFVDSMTKSMGNLLDDRLKYFSPNETAEHKFLDGIFISDPRDDRSALIARKGRHVEGTCIWVTQTPQYRSWFSTNAPSPGLILEGGPGKGKSMMAIFLTRQLEDLAKQSDNESTIYFFCDNSNARQNNALSVFRCLIWQLCRLKPELLSHGTKELSYRGNNIQHLLDPPSTGVETLWRIFRSMIMDEKAGTISCVIDGLDECDDDSIFQILDKLHELAAEAESDPARRNFRFIILSRPHTAGQKLPQLGVNLPKVRLDPDSDKEVHSDIKTFIDKQIDDLADASTENLWPAPFREQVTKILHEKAGGTFLWVGFVCQDLRSKTPMEVKECLKTLPVGLDGIYDRMLRKIPPQRRQAVRSILRWVCFAHHPLRPTELAGLIDEKSSGTSSQSSMNSDSSSESDSDDDMMLEGAPGPGTVSRLQYLLRFCNHFVLLAESREPIHELAQTVQFVHQSAKDYLMRRVNGRNSDVDYFRMGKRRAMHEHLGLHCIDLLTQKAASMRKQCVYRARNIIDQPDPYYFAAADYAAMFWVHHLHQSGDIYHPYTHTQILQLCQDKISRSVWAWATEDYSDNFVDSFRYPQVVRDENPPMLTIAAALGLNSTVRELIDGMTVEEYTSVARLSSTKPLNLAFDEGFDGILHTLLEFFGSPAISLEPDILTKAVRKDYWVPQETVKRLLNISNNPREIFGDHLEFALIHSVVFDNEANFKLLVDAGANPVLADKMVPLVSASIDKRYRKGADIHRPKLLEWLTSLGLADVANSYRIFPATGKTSLQRVTSEQAVDEWIAQTLHDAGARVEAAETPSQSPSQSPSHYTSSSKSGRLIIPNEKRVKALLLSGSDVNAVDEFRRTPLLQLLVTVLDGFFWGAAMKRAWSSSTSNIARKSVPCMELLRQAGANGNVQDCRGKSPLHFLAEIMVLIGPACRSLFYMAAATGKASIMRVKDLSWSTNSQNTWHLTDVLPMREGLFKFNIDLDLRDQEGRTARDIYPVDVFWDVASD